jgi:hypothetical protein
MVNRVRLDRPDALLGHVPERHQQAVALAMADATPPGLPGAQPAAVCAGDAFKAALAAGPGEDAGRRPGH